MKRALPIVLLLSAFFSLSQPRPASACPFCQEVLSSARDGEEESDSMREARAYNNSILFMLSMPYLLLSVFGTLVYRGLRGQRQSRPAVTANEPPSASALGPAEASPSPSSPAAES